MSWPCFMLEAVNRRESERDCCDRKHASDEPCNQNGRYIEVLYDYQRQDTGEVVVKGVEGPFFGHMPVGAMWWLTVKDDEPANHYFGRSGEFQVLCVQTPGGLWEIDSRASNCTMKDDNTHRCWVRHGEPPAITVDKNGLTCAAGAGSIQCGSYHGFLRDGHLT